MIVTRYTFHRWLHLQFERIIKDHQDHIQRSKIPPPQSSSNLSQRSETLFKSSTLEPIPQTDEAVLSVKNTQKALMKTMVKDDKVALEYLASIQRRGTTKKVVPLSSIKVEEGEEYGSKRGETLIRKLTGRRFPGGAGTMNDEARHLEENDDNGVPVVKEEDVLQQNETEDGLGNHSNAAENEEERDTKECRETFQTLKPASILQTHLRQLSVSFSTMNKSQVALQTIGVKNSTDIAPTDQDTKTLPPPPSSPPADLPTTIEDDDEVHEITNRFKLQTSFIFSSFYVIIGTVLIRQNSQDSSFFFFTATLTVASDLALALWMTHVVVSKEQRNVTDLVADTNISQERIQQIRRQSAHNLQIHSTSLFSTLLLHQIAVFIAALFAFTFTTTSSPFLTFQKLTCNDLDPAQIFTRMIYILALQNLCIVTLVFIQSVYWNLPVLPSSRKLKPKKCSYGVGLGMLMVYMGLMGLVTRGGVFEGYYDESLMVCRFA
ncbi:hypothetical protein HDV05_000687 [Chytridiales sp. JEL 0842]|nr:hypothetical protein HDV05_000687 [Chytridiales sp. JEL 0842]